MNDNIEKFVGDMRKILEFERNYGKMEYTQQMSKAKLIISAFENDLIKSSLDLVYICNEIPEISYDLCRYFDAYILSKGIGRTRGIRKLKAMVKKEEYMQDNRIGRA